MADGKEEKKDEKGKDKKEGKEEKKKDEGKEEKKKDEGKEEKKKDDNEVITAIYKVNLHCQECGNKIKKHLMTTQGMNLF